MIILTKTQADQVRGPTANGAALMPVKLASGQYVLPEDVLSDLNHEMHHELLASLPTRAVRDNEWIRETEE